MRQILIVKPEYRTEFGIIGLLDRAELVGGDVIDRADLCLIEVEADHRLWRRSQFKPRELERLYGPGQIINPEDHPRLTPAAHLKVIDWNARQSARPKTPKEALYKHMGWKLK